MLDTIYKTVNPSFERIANDAKYKKPNVPSYLYIFWLNFDKANHSFLHPCILLRETDFRDRAAGKNE